jgi:thiol-disulfide isomerase/thioredoxin
MSNALRPSVLLAASAGLAALALAACSPAPQTAEAPAALHTAEPAKMTARHIANFQLNDETGKPFTLYDQKDAKAVVLVMHGNGCPIVQKLTPTLKEVAGEYSSKNVKFFMVNSNSQDTPSAIAAEVAKFELGIHVLKDADQTIGRKLGAERTAEVFVVDPKSWTIVFHGPIDDRLTYGTERPVAKNFYLKDTLNAVLAGKPVPAVEAKADGCIINYLTPEKA